MKVQIKPRFEPVSQEQVALLEEKIKFHLPGDYRDFLLQFNGGSPTPNIFFISPEQQESSLSVFYGIISDDRTYDLWANARDAFKDIGRHFLPIGQDPGGNQVCMNLHADHYGQIFFREHEMQGAGSAFSIANSFTDFLEKLY